MSRRRKYNFLWLTEIFFVRVKNPYDVDRFEQDELEADDYTLFYTLLMELSGARRFENSGKYLPFHLLPRT
jgi:hypothetical protein